jgi:hypothetical protein
MLRLPVGWFHSRECASLYALGKSRQAKTKAERKLYRERKQAIKPKSTLMQEADKAFQAYIRYRDKDLPCINTGQYIAWDDNQSDAAHFISKAANTAMRYDLRNCHKSTKASNAMQEKYIHDYRNNLFKRLGEERFAKFEADRQYWATHQRKFSVEYLERVKRIFRKKKRVLMRIRGD